MLLLQLSQDREKCMEELKYIMVDQARKTAINIRKQEANAMESTLENIL